MDQVRLGLIGCGNIFGMHMSYLPKLSNVQVTAVADNADAGRKRGREKAPEAKMFESGDELIDSGLVDAILICTPHYDHPVFAAKAMARGIHVLTEKPVAVTAKAAEEVNELHKQYPDVIYAAMFNQRTREVHQKIRELCTDGTLGELQRVNYTITKWFRSQIYYDGGDWRATWSGEGGGVIINQCPHNLDLIQWWVGLPNRVTAKVGLGKYHNIEVEDEVIALLEYPNGAVGTFVTTTGEAPGVNRLEVVGDNATLIYEEGPTLRMIANSQAASEYCRTTTNAFGTPDRYHYTIECPGKNPEHRGITENFIDAILNGAELLAPAEEGIRGLELGNAMVMSGIQNRPIDIPTPREEFDAMIQDLAAKSTYVKKAPAETVATDMSQSF